MDRHAWETVIAIMDSGAPREVLALVACHAKVTPIAHLGIGVGKTTVATILAVWRVSVQREISVAVEYVL